ncbi:ABC transporter ATP-binding protein [Alphaproteobacteria bacterium]|nr:ABC transporter ATP-binding protein [Alphaproteobacteria bacterium]
MNQKNKYNTLKAINVSNLSKIYSKGKNTSSKTALNNIDLSINEGEIFGLLGPNGAGKSTLINILAGLVIKTRGNVEICGYDIDKNPRFARKSIGVVPQELTLDPFFTPRESLDLQAGLYGVRKKYRRTQEIIESLHLSDVAEGYSRRMSGGMKRRLMMGKAMVHSPKVLVLDEPTAGVDVELRQHLWSLVKELNKTGTTILLTTHYLEEAEELCDRIAIVNDGNIVACEKTIKLVNIIDRKELILVLENNMKSIPKELEKFNPVFLSPNTLSLSYKRSELQIDKILDLIHSLQLRVKDLSTKESDLEDVFISLTKKMN